MISKSQRLSFSQKIDFLRGHARRFAPWPMAGGLLIAALWFLSMSTIRHETKEINARAHKAAAAQAQTYAEQIERTIGQLDYIILNLRFQWQENGGKLNLEKQLDAGLVPKKVEISLSVFDRHGLPVTTTSSAIGGEKGIASRDYFQAHATSSSKDLVISKPSRSILTGRDIITLSRRLDTQDGDFAGVIVAAIEPVFLASFVDESNLGTSDFVAIRSVNGDFIASKTKNGLRSQSPNFSGKFGFDGPSGVLYRPADQYRDSKARIVGWHTGSTYPMMVIVGLAEETLQAGYEPRRREIYLIFMLGSLMLVMATGAGMRQSVVRAWRTQHTREVREAYRMATENAREGFYMLRALYGPNKDIVDFLIEDCNERGAMYRGLSRDEMIGKTMTATLPVFPETHIMAACQTAMDAGIFEDEICVPAHGTRETRWFQMRIVRASAGLAVTLRDTTDNKAHQEMLVQLANSDSVTTLPNRHWLMQHLPVAVENARTMGKVLAVMFVDLDDFKNINDTLGHAIGDELLKAAALRLKAVIRPQDKVARLGGDEFTILVEAAQSREEVAAVAERVIETLRMPFILGEGERRHSMHASVGISLFPQDGDDGETLLKHADIAMYVVKSSRKGTYRFFEASHGTSLLTRLSREAELKQAIEFGELVLHYQPRVRSDTGEISSMEALVRWMHPTQGLLPPDDFIPIAEKSGLIVPLGAEVVRMACKQLAQWKSQELQVVPVSVNVSAQQIDMETLSTMLAGALKENGLDASLLEVEVTESATVTKDGDAVTELATIQKTGIKLYVDDFGTGYSCLAQLKHLDMDGLKIDRAFTSQLLSGRADAALFEAIVAMGHALEMRVVAEGVETAEQLAALQALGCEELQGYYISRPVPPADAGLLLQKRFLFPVL